MFTLPLIFITSILLWLAWVMDNPVKKLYMLSVWRHTTGRRCLPFHLYRVNINLSMPSALTSQQCSQDSPQKTDKKPCLLSAYLLFNWVIKQQTHRQMIKAKKTLLEYIHMYMQHIVTCISFYSFPIEQTSWRHMWETEMQHKLMRGRKKGERAEGEGHWGNTHVDFLHLASAWVHGAQILLRIPKRLTKLFAKWKIFYELIELWMHL